MAKVTKKEILTELKDGRTRVYETMDGQLEHSENIKATKEQFENYRDELKKKYPDYIVDRELELFHVRMKLNTVLAEKQLIDKLDIAIEFLEKAIELQSTDYNTE
jgi:hypothetical protein